MKKFLFFLTIVLASFCLISCDPEVEIYTVTFDANGAEGKAPASIEVESGGGCLIIPSENTLSKNGYEFTSWNTEKDGSGDSYAVSETVKIDSDVTLYAQWKALAKYTITLDFNMTAEESFKMYFTMYEGEIFVVPSCDSLSNEGYIFDIWNTVSDESGKSYFGSESIKIYDNMTLYAIWKPSYLDYTYSAATDSYSIKCNDKTISSVDIPSSYKGKAVTGLASSAFNGCSNLTEVQIPEGITSIMSYAFGSCSSLTKVIIPDSVTNIGSYAFGSCSNLTKVSIPSSVTTINDSAFSGCGLIEVVLPNSVTKIAKDLFELCKSLIKITIPSSVTNIGEGALYFCTNLTRIDYDGTIEQWNAIKKHSNEYYSWNSNTGNYTIHCEDGDIAKGQSSSL